MKKRNITFAILLLAVVLTAVGVSGTYARYITTDTGTGTATVAKWAVAFKNGSTTLANTFSLTLDQEENTYVAKEKIAPAAEVYKELTVDLTGTEVATDIEAKIESLTGITGTDTRFHASLEVVGNPAGVTVTTDETTGVTTISVGLNSGRTAIATNTVTIKVKLVWDNLESSNSDDTTMGTAPGNITANLSLTAKQHIAE